MRSGGLIDPDTAAELLDLRDPAMFSERLLETAHTAAGVEHADHVVLACHSDQSLALLADIRDDERSVLEAVRYHLTLIKA